MTDYDVIILGAGAAGLFCAAQAAKRGRSVLVLDHAKRLGGKILMSGGGRCNFTNMYTSHENFLSQNPHFCKSALSRYTQWDFIALVNQYDIPHHEKTLGQLFCDRSAKDIVDMLLQECAQSKLKILNRTLIKDIDYVGEQYSVATDKGLYTSASLVIATGGLSMPKLGATPLGYQVAEQFGLNIVPTRAALVPFTLHEADKTRFAEISGVAMDADVSCKHSNFNESILFTHRGLSGPAVLQISSYWQPGDTVYFDLSPHTPLSNYLDTQLNENPEQSLVSALAGIMPKRAITQVLAHLNVDNKALKQYPGNSLKSIAEQLHSFQIKPNGTEGYRTAEVTLGGVDTTQLSSKTMEATNQKGLYFIGEVVDVTGWLGGFNFQWAWSSGWVAGQYV